MIYKPIPRKNGSVYLCPIALSSATEDPITTKDEVIYELSQEIDSLLTFIETLPNHSLDQIFDELIPNLLQKYQI